MDLGISVWRDIHDLPVTAAFSPAGDYFFTKQDRPDCHSHC